MKKRFILIYSVIVVAVFVLTAMNMVGKDYAIIKAPGVNNTQFTDEADTPHEVCTTDKITLTKGYYNFTVNYATAIDAKIEAYDGRTLIAEGMLEANPEGGYYVTEMSLAGSTSEFYWKITDPEGLEIYNYEIQKNGRIVYDDIFYAILVLAFAAIVLFIIYNYLNGKYDTQRLVVLLSMIATVIFVTAPVFNDYLIYGFDIQFHLSRIEGIKDAFSDGQFVPIIYPGCNNGYGVLGIMYPSLFLVPSALLRMCNVSMVAAYHFFVLMVNVLTVVIAWIASRTFTGSDKISLLCVLLCACNPLRLTNLYQCAAIGAVLGMAFMPLFFAGIYETIYGDRKKWYYITIAFTGMIMSHILSCIIVAVISFVIFVLSAREIFDRKEKRYIQLAMALALFLLINLWYIILFVRYYGYSLNNAAIFTDHYYKDTIIPTKLFMMSNANMPYPQSDQGILDGCAQGPGIAGLIGLLVMFADVIIPDSENKIRKKWLGICLALIAVFMFMGTSAFPWYSTMKIGPIARFMGTVQFPHRFYAEVTPILFLLAPVSVEKLSQRQDEFIRKNAGYAKIILTVIGAFAIIFACTIMDTYNVQTPFKTVYSGGYASYPLTEYLPKDTDTEIFNSTVPHNFGSETLSYTQDGTRAEIECKVYDEGAYVLLPILYYPGYHAVGEDGTKYSIGRCPDGRIQVYLPVTEEAQKIRVNMSGKIFNR